MIVGIHQPHYLPWLRYMHKVVASDVFVILDTIQFNKNGWQNRNKIKTPEGSAILTVPVLQKFAQNLNEVQIDPKHHWAKKHWKTISMSYSKAPYFEDHAPFFEKIYQKGWEKLNDLNREMFSYYVEALGIKTKIVYASEMDLEGEATERLVHICKTLGGSSYLTGAFAAEAYLEPELFKQAGLELKMQEFEAPVYGQQYPKAGFVPELAIIDLLFNCGPRSLDILMAGANSPASSQS